MFKNYGGFFSSSPFFKQDKGFFGGSGISQQQHEHDEYDEERPYHHTARDEDLAETNNVNERMAMYGNMEKEYKEALLEEEDIHFLTEISPDEKIPEIKVGDDNINVGNINDNINNFRNIIKVQQEYIKNNPNAGDVANRKRLIAETNANLEKLRSFVKNVRSTHHNAYITHLKLAKDVKLLNNEVTNYTNHKNGAEYDRLNEYKAQLNKLTQGILDASKTKKRFENRVGGHKEHDDLEDLDLVQDRIMLKSSDRLLRSYSKEAKELYDKMYYELYTLKERDDVDRYNRGLAQKKYEGQQKLINRKQEMDNEYLQQLEAEEKYKEDKKKFYGVKKEKESPYDRAQRIAHETEEEKNIRIQNESDKFFKQSNVSRMASQKKHRDSRYSSPQTSYSDYGDTQIFNPDDFSKEDQKKMFSDEVKSYDQDHELLKFMNSKLKNLHNVTSDGDLILELDQVVPRLLNESNKLIQLKNKPKPNKNDAIEADKAWKYINSYLHKSLDIASKTYPQGYAGIFKQFAQDNKNFQQPKSIKAPIDEGKDEEKKELEILNDNNFVTELKRLTNENIVDTINKGNKDPIIQSLLEYHNNLISNYAPSVLDKDDDTEKRLNKIKDESLLIKDKIDGFIDNNNNKIKGLKQLDGQEFNDKLKEILNDLYALIKRVNVDYKKKVN